MTLKTATNLRRGSGEQVVGQASGLLAYLVESIGFRTPYRLVFLSIPLQYGFVGMQNFCGLLSNT